MLGTHLTAGLKFLITKTFSLDLQGRYIVWSDDVKVEDSTESTTFDIRGYTTFVVLSFRFD